MMRAFFDLHTHTLFSDGEDSPEAMVKAAVDKGMSAIGFSDHSDTRFDQSYCMKAAQYADYRDRIKALKQAYRDEIAVFCGIEQDYYAETKPEGFDYVIGSVHYLCVNGAYIPVDETPEIIKAAADRYFNGELMGLCEAYFETVSDVVRQTGADVIGHFDLISKFNENNTLFDTASSRYTAAWQKAANRLLETGKPFEINTGAMSRGYRSRPYPDEKMITYLAEHGGRFVLSGDAHSARTIGYAFETIEEMVPMLKDHRMNWDAFFAFIDADKNL